MKRTTSAVVNKVGILLPRRDPSEPTAAASTGSAAAPAAETTAAATATGASAAARSAVRAGPSATSQNAVDQDAAEDRSCRIAAATAGSLVCFPGVDVVLRGAK